MNEFLRHVIRGCQARSLFANAGISVRSAILPSLLSSDHHAMHADAEVDMSAVGRVGSICRAAEDGAPDPDRRANLARSMPCATGKIRAQSPPRRFTWKLVALRYERFRRSSTIRPPHAAAVRRRRCLANAGSILIAHGHEGFPPSAANLP